VGTGIATGLVVITWVVVDFLLAVTYGIYRLATRSGGLALDHLPCVDGNTLGTMAVPNWQYRRPAVADLHQGNPAILWGAVCKPLPRHAAGRSLTLGLTWT
jgi:hypothetical protein